ncbi:hypothetical protein [Lysinibacillus capsici]|nr:hypothetical protein [Lysinibacillus capsici]
MYKKMLDHLNIQLMLNTKY